MPPVGCKDLQIWQFLHSIVILRRIFFLFFFLLRSETDSISSVSWKSNEKIQDTDQREADQYFLKFFQLCFSLRALVYLKRTESEEAEGQTSQQTTNVSHRDGEEVIADLYRKWSEVEWALTWTEITTFRWDTDPSELYFTAVGSGLPPRGQRTRRSWLLVIGAQICS